jgi:protoporphyrin/coproporphyrin ferrochelatase
MLWPASPPSNDGVLLVGHGTVDNLEELPSFLTEIRRGRPPSEDLVREMRRRYEAIGGSPLMRITRSQASALSSVTQLPVLVGMRFGLAPLPAALLGAAALRLDRLIVLPVAPFSVELYSKETTLTYERLKSEGHSLNFELLTVMAWGCHPRLIEAQREMILSYLGAKNSDDLRIVVTAHSLPLRVIELGDDYARQVEAAAHALELALGRKTILAYQSQGQDAARWLGPTLGDRLAELANSGVKDVAVVPMGFLCDHVETLYDLDLEAQVRANQLGLNMTRVPALNAHPSLIDAMAKLVQECTLRAASAASIPADP